MNVHESGQQRFPPQGNQSDSFGDRFSRWYQPLHMPLRIHQKTRARVKAAVRQKQIGLEEGVHSVIDSTAEKNFPS